MLSTRATAPDPAQTHEPAATSHTPIAKLLLTPKEAAACLSVSKSHVYRLIQTGELRVVRSRGAVRLPLAELEMYVARLMDERRKNANT